MFVHVVICVHTGEYDVLGVMGCAGPFHCSFAGSPLRSSSIEDGVGVGAASAQSSPDLVVRSRSIVEGVGDGGGAASAHSDPVVLGFGVMVVCALLSTGLVEVAEIVDVVGVGEVGGGGVIVAVVALVVVVVVVWRFCRRSLSFACRASCKRLINWRRFVLLFLFLLLLLLLFSSLSAPSSSNVVVAGVNVFAAGESCIGCFLRGSMFCRQCLFGMKSAALLLNIGCCAGSSSSSLSLSLLNSCAVAFAVSMAEAVVTAAVIAASIMSSAICALKADTSVIVDSSVVSVVSSVVSVDSSV